LTLPSTRSAVAEQGLQTGKSYIMTANSNRFFNRASPLPCASLPPKPHIRKKPIATRTWKKLRPATLGVIIRSWVWSRAHRVNAVQVEKIAGGNFFFISPCLKAVRCTCRLTVPIAGRDRLFPCDADHKWQCIAESSDGPGPFCESAGSSSFRPAGQDEVQIGLWESVSGA